MTLDRWSAPVVVSTVSCLLVAGACLLVAGNAMASLVINEVQADNENTIADDHGEHDDWFEILNLGAASIDLAGYWVTDEADLSDPYLLSGPLPLAPGGRVLLWADGQPDQGVDHLPFRLSSTGETIALLAPDGVTVVDQVTFERQFADRVYQRFPDGGGWTWGRDPSPLLPNTAPQLPGFLILNELMPENRTIIADGAGDFDPWIELFNPLPVPISLAGMVIEAAGGGSAVMPDEILEGRTYALAWLDAEPWQGPWHLPAFLSAAGGGLSILADDGVVASNALYPALAVDVAYARMPDGGPWAETVMVTPGQTNPASNAPSVVINEFLALNEQGITDPSGAHEDWLELHNPGDTALLLDGYFLTDDLAEPDQWALPSVVIEPGGFLLLWCDGDPEEGALHGPMRLAAGGEEIGLYEGEHLVDSIVFGPQEADVSTGRRVDAGLPWITFAEPTPGATNAGAVAVGDSPAVDLQVTACPNPFNPRVELTWRQARPGRVRATVHDLRGRRVATLVEDLREAGGHRVTWDGRGDDGRALPSGAYLVAVEAGGRRAHVQVALVR